MTSSMIIFMFMFVYLYSGSIAVATTPIANKTYHPNMLKSIMKYIVMVFIWPAFIHTLYKND